MYQYTTRGTCSRLITFDVVDGKVHDVAFEGGCNGNLQGISRLVEGMDAQQAIDTLDGIICGRRTTSCPDQLARALNAALEGQKA